MGPRRPHDNKFRKSTEFHKKILAGRKSSTGMADKEMKEYEHRQASLETVCRRHNSTMVVKKHAIPYASLHKKTYFNALEKILISPRRLTEEELE